MDRPYTARHGQFRRQDRPRVTRGSAAKSFRAWAGSLIFALFLLFLILFDAQAAYQHQWANVTGISVFTLIYLIIPTGGARWLRRPLRDRKLPRSPNA